MKGARRNEENVVGLYRAVLGGDGGSLDERQEIALDALAADVAAAAEFGARTDLVDLVEEDDAIVLDGLDGLAKDRILVEKLFGLFCDERRVRVGDAEPLGLGSAAKGLAEDIAQIDHG